MNTQQEAQDALDALNEARDAYKKFQEAWEQVGNTLFRLDRTQWHRVDAYPGWHGTRDQGGRVDMLGWMQEVEESLNDTRDTQDDGAYEPESDDERARNAYIPFGGK